MKKRPRENEKERSVSGVAFSIIQVTHIHS